MADPVRTPIGPNARLPTRRPLDERLFVRWPRAYEAFSRALFGLPPRSRLRRAALRRAVLSGWSAWARRDFDLMLVRYAPDCHIEPLQKLLAAGMGSSYRGHAGLRELAADWREAWERMDLMPRQIVDAGDRVVVLGDSRLRARGSGIEFDTPVGSALWVERGLVVHQRDFDDWEAALRAAGLSEAPVERDRQQTIDVTPPG